MLKIIFLILVIVHGLIHLLGFAKAFHLVEVGQLTQNISKPAGVLWLIACVLFLITGLLKITGNPLWWLPGFMAIVLSQALIFFAWHDAKFGTIANLIVLIVAIPAIGSWNFYRQYQQDVKACFLNEPNINNEMLTEADIYDLPDPVKNYLRYTGAVGKPKLSNFNIRFTGKIRGKGQGKWMLFSSEQYNFIESAARLFFMRATMKHLPVDGYHHFKKGNAVMDIRLLSLLKVQYFEGEEMNVSETVTFFNDMCCMAPATLIDKRISWNKVNGNEVNASFTNNNITISATLQFNDEGQLINFVSNDRMAADAGKKLPWATPLSNYREINGYKLASNAELIYTYPDGDFCYGIFALDTVIYNCSE